MTELAKSFEPAAIEAHWGPLWESSGAYRPTLDTNKPSFSIQLPPPNVTGTLHMGHAFNQTIMDSLTRYHRMRGFNTLWVPGTDHAGIATQIVVERQLQEAGISRHELGRESFLKHVWDWKHSSGATITRQMRRMGASVSWEHEYFTMDDKLSKVVTDTFVKLYEEGLIYRGKRLVNWDPVLQSAVSDLEVEHVESDGRMHYVCYPFVDGPQPIEGQLQRHIAVDAQSQSRQAAVELDGVLAAVDYCDVAKSLVYKLKYGRKPGASRVMADFMYRHAQRHPQSALVPVPLHRIRLWTRGFNQSLSIARALARLTGHEVLPTALVRHKRTSPLEGLGRRDRAREVAGAIRVSDAVKPRLQGRDILLVDDVYTTGATANVCAQALKKAGAGSVRVLSWARVLKDDV